MKIGKKWIASLLALILVIESLSAADLNLLQVQKVYADTIPSFTPASATMAIPNDVKDTPKTLVDSKTPTTASNLRSTAKTDTFEITQLDMSNSDLSVFSNQLIANTTTTSSALSIPSNVIVVSTDTTITVSWNSVAEAESYDISLDDNITSTTATNYTYNNLKSNIQHKVKVRTVNQGGNSEWSTEQYFTINAEGINSQIPSTPCNLTSQNQTETSIDLSWDASQGDVIKEYEVYKGSELIGKSECTNFQAKDLLPGTDYIFTVRAVDGMGNVSNVSNEITVKTKPDTQAPTAPNNLIVVKKSNSTISLSWNPSEDNVKVSGYIIYNYSIPVCTSSAISCTLDNLPQGTIFNLNVKAVDIANNLSDASNNISVTTDEFQDKIINSDLTLNEDTIYNNLYINGGTLNLNGYKLTVTGNLIQYNGTLAVSGGQLNVTGDYRLQNESKASDGTITYGMSYGELKMTNAKDYVTVGGSFVTQSYHVSDYLTNGVLEVKGDFIQRGGSGYSFCPSGSNKVILSGVGLQTATMEYSGSKAQE